MNSSLEALPVYKTSCLCDIMFRDIYLDLYMRLYSMRINPPDFKSKSYERYKRELEAWKQITEVDKKKQGIAIALSLPEEHESGTCIREKVFDEIDLNVLNADDGLAKLLVFLDQKLGKDELSDSLEKFEDFEDFCRDSKQRIVEYIANFARPTNVSSSIPR